MLNQLITSKTRLRLLIKFFISQANRGYLNGLANEFNESTNSIRKELNHLSEAGYLEKYKDNNNFVEFNDAVCADDKFTIQSPNQYFFLNFVQNPFWDSQLYVKTETVSKDGGKTFIQTKDEIILGLYFFVYD